MNFEIKRRRAFTVAGVLYRGKNENQEITKLWNEQFFKDINSLKNTADHGIYYGVCDNYNCETGEFEYIAGREVSCVSEIPEKMSLKNIPEQSYAVFKTTLPEMLSCYNNIYEEFRKQNEFKIVSGPSFEYYPEHFCDGQKVYIYIPVEKSDEE